MTITAHGDSIDDCVKREMQAHGIPGVSLAIIQDRRLLSVRAYGKTEAGEGTPITPQLTGQDEFPIFPESDHEFYWKVVPAKVDFIRDPAGKVTGAIHHQNGVTFSAPKLPVNSP